MKKIYYYWTGGEMTENERICIESWKRVMPDYEIEKIPDHYGYDECRFSQIAQKSKNYAFLADVARIKWLKEHDGIYLDTDMFMVRRIPDEILNAGFVFSADSHSKEMYFNNAFILKNKHGQHVIDEWWNEIKNLNKCRFPRYQIKPILERINHNNVLFLKPEFAEPISSLYFYKPRNIEEYYKKKSNLNDNTCLIHLHSIYSIKSEKSTIKAYAKYIKENFLNEKIIEFIEKNTDPALGLKELFEKMC